jgi:serine/threonine-protein kinase RsbW
MVIRGRPAQIQRVREDVEGALVVYPFSDRDIFSVLLALEEALANAIKHGNRMDRHKKVTIRYRVSSKRFDIQIVDEGGGFQPDEVPDPTAEENLDRPSGRGLFLTRQYMTEVAFHPPGNRLSMSLVRNPISSHQVDHHPSG